MAYMKCSETGSLEYRWTVCLGPEVIAVFTTLTDANANDFTKVLNRAAA